MAEAVYILCALTSALCAVLLYRGYRLSGARLLLWSACCFLGLALNNAILFIDLIVLPQVDLSVLRLLPAVIGMLLLLFGLIWDIE
jgi:hypothetical protein